MRRFVLIFILMAISAMAYAQADRSFVRSGNSKFGKGDYRAAAVEYMRGLDADSLSFASNYDMASVHYRLGDYASAGESLEKIKELAPDSPYRSDYFFNAGDVAIAKKDWQGAVDAFKQCLLGDPDNIQAKENYIYAKKHLENQQNGGQGQNQDQQDNQDNQDQNQDQNQQDQQDQDRNQDKNQPSQGQAEVKVSPEQARQMLQAIQDKERKTQEKVDKTKAEKGVIQNEKNW